jgi:ABC-type uncharacterized transport system permease subunit
VAQGAVILFWFTMVAYVAATVLYAYYFLSKRPAYSWYATFLTGAGYLCHTASIGMRSSAEHGTRLDGPNTLILFAWALVLLYFVMEHLIKVKVYGTLLVPLSVVLMTISQLIAGSGAATSPLIENWKIGIHVALIAFANGGFFIAAAAALTYLIQEGQLKRHQTNVFFKRLPPLGRIDMLARRAVAFAYPAYTGGLLLGVLRAIETDPPGWWSDPRVMLAGIAWFVFGAYLGLHYTQRASARTTSWIAIAGTAVVVTLAVIARAVPAGFHIFGT